MTIRYVRMLVWYVRPRLRWPNIDFISATPSLTIYSEAHEFLMRRESWSKPYMLAAVNMMLFGRCLDLP
jgi:hypothetical protein